MLAKCSVFSGPKVARVVIGKVNDIAPGERKLVVPFRGRAGIGVFNVKGSFHALRNICPHNLGPLCTGRVTGHVTSEGPMSTNLNGLRFERDGEILRCPWHLWEFEIATGQCLVDPNVLVKTYPVNIDGDEIVVEYDD